MHKYLYVLSQGARKMLEIQFTEQEFQGLLDKIDVDFNEKSISILRDFYVRGAERKQVSEEHGVSRSYVSRILNRFGHAVTHLPDEEIRNISIVLKDSRSDESGLTLTGKLKRHGRKT
jgi:hypothetical protein